MPLYSGNTRNPALVHSVAEGSSLLKEIPEVVRDVVTMLLPVATDFCKSFARTTLESLMVFIHVAFADSNCRSVRRVNPIRNFPEDLYLRGDLEAMLSWCWPLPSADCIAQAKPALRGQIERVMRRDRWYVSPSIYRF